MFCHITSHIDTDPHQDLLAAMGGNAFPYIVFLDPEGSIVLKYDLAPQQAWQTEGFVKAADEVDAYLELRKKAENGTTADKVHLFELQLDRDLLGYDEARAKLDALMKLEDFGQVLTEAQLAAIDQQLVNLEFSDFFDGLQQVRSREEAFTKAGKKILAMREAGKVPDGDLGLNFWNLLMYYAELEKDRDLLEDAAKSFKAMLDPKDSRQLRLIRTIDQRVERAKAW